ncbi:MAG: haloacid dehalogenase-like hydrolase [Pseudomonadota bacterium]
MEYKAFSAELLNHLQSSIKKLKSELSPPYYAAFDADGTLWDSDLGEQFFQYQIDHCNLPALQEVDPWHHYKSAKEKDPPPAYLWLAQINAGVPLETVRQWAQEAVDQKGANVFQAQKDWISWLQDQEIEVFIVTASIQWAVEPAAKLVGIPFENVMGIKTKVVDGIVGQEQDGPITWRQGKGQALLERTSNIRPLFCSGNTYGDISLLETSIGEKLCIQTQYTENSLFEEERKLRDKAKTDGWLQHGF